MLSSGIAGRFVKIMVNRSIRQYSQVLSLNAKWTHVVQYKIITPIFRYSFIGTEPYWGPNHYSQHWHFGPFFNH
jgi:hypothetical protein